MSTGLKQLGEPQGLAISLDAAKAHLNVDFPQQDSFITRLIQSSTRDRENYTNRSFLLQSWQLALDALPPGQLPIRLPRPPLVSLQAFDAIGYDGTVTAVDPTTFGVNQDVEPGLVVLRPNQSWPVKTDAILYFRLQYTAGYGLANDADSPLPIDLQEAIFQIVGFRYENRGSADVPPAANTLCDPYVVYWME